MMHDHDASIEHLRIDHNLEGWDTAIRMNNGYSLDDIHKAEHATSPTVFVLIESYGLIPSPLLFQTQQQMEQHVYERLLEEGVSKFIYPTVQGGNVGDATALSEKLEDMDKAEAARILVDEYLGGCIFDDNGNEFRAFEMEAV